MTDKSMEKKELTAASENLENGDSLNISNQSDEIDDPELELVKTRAKELEEEAKIIKEIQRIDVIEYTAPAHISLSIEEKMAIDARSIYVGNVDYGATPEELEAHFQGCGSINRVSIQCDKFSSHSKGFAYIEFADQDSVSTSTALDESWFKDRQIKVLPKRTNCPGISSTNRPPRRFHRPSRPHFSGYRPVRRSFRRRSWYYPY